MWRKTLQASAESSMTASLATASLAAVVLVASPVQ
jgi:hypothetical protein